MTDTLESERDSRRTSSAEDMADEALRDLFSGLARPSLSPRFHRELRLRLAEERAQLRRSRRWALALSVYWLTAVTASLVILLRLPLAGTLADASDPTRLVLLFGCMLPVVILLHVTRTDPWELALSSTEWLSNPLRGLRAGGRDEELRDLPR